MISWNCCPIFFLITAFLDKLLLPSYLDDWVVSSLVFPVPSVLFCSASSPGFSPPSSSEQWQSRDDRSIQPLQSPPVTEDKAETPGHVICLAAPLLSTLTLAHTVWWFQDAWHSLYIEILHTSAFLTVWFLFPGICSPTCSIWCISFLPFHTQMCSHLGSFPGTPGELPFSWFLQWLLLTS